MIPCHWCSEEPKFANLSLHLLNAHGRTAADYRLAFPGAPLIDTAYQIEELKNWKERLGQLGPTALVEWLLEETGELTALQALAADYNRRYPRPPWDALEMEVLFVVTLRLRALVTGATNLPPLP